MVLHELVTNAARYGALSTPHGRVEVSWSLAGDADAAELSIEWREIGGPAVAASPTCRYGVTIIRDLIPHELSGTVDLAFASGGVCCKIAIPLAAVRDERDGQLVNGTPTAAPLAPVAAASVSMPGVHTRA
jgi:two-component sensor histidine kinase